MQTNTNKLFAGAMIGAMTIISPFAHAATVGSGTVSGNSSLKTDINWNGTYGGTANASGSINGLTVKARVLPSLNMVVSGSGTIELGDLNASSYSSGSVGIEIGTNAVGGASVTAKSTNGGLRSSDGVSFINNATTDGMADSYIFSSTLGTNDSSFGSGLNPSAMAEQEISNTNPVTIYSSAKPQGLDTTADVNFKVSAKPNAETPAGDYSDIIVLTVTGNF